METGGGATLLVVPTVRARAGLHVLASFEEGEAAVAARRADLLAVVFLDDPDLLDLRLLVGREERGADADLLELHAASCTGGRASRGLALAPEGRGLSQAGSASSSARLWMTSSMSPSL